METWFTSDHHFGHANIIGFCDRGFVYPNYPYAPDVDAMNEALVTAWNETVAPNDRVYHLGDFAMGRIQDTLGFAAKLNGRVYLLPGNHDRCWVGHPKENKVRKARLAYLRAGFHYVYDVNELEYEGYVVSHFPYSGTAYDERYAEWRPRRNGRPLIHGHVHDTWKVKDDQINVGVDVWDFRPVNFDTIRELLPA